MRAEQTTPPFEGVLASVLQCDGARIVVSTPAVTTVEVGMHELMDSLSLDGDYVRKLYYIIIARGAILGMAIMTVLYGVYMIWIKKRSTQSGYDAY
ncbi:hypothetical protein Tcan_06280 [Toxocara canis]|uniref:Uncharacterized protein n=1 Tax=Toxocara canis TaxID=6265 RepID=A0A0B2URL1_TOXCA|nr:hypothetical protein Tcan_06280 [Toxocara canis]